MRSYKIHQNSSGSVIAVKDGWSWGGFLFGFLWAWFRKLWLVGFLILFSLIALGVILGVAEAPEWVINIFIIVFPFVIGFSGNKWRSQNLIKRGYAYVQQVEAKNASEAATKYMTDRLKAS